jgi:hypothetical protein
VRGDDAILFEDDTLKLHDERTRQACPKPSAAGASRAAGLWGVSEATFYAPPATRSVIFSARSRTLPAGSAIADRGPCCVPLDNPEIDAHFNVPDAPTPKCPERHDMGSHVRDGRHAKRRSGSRTVRAVVRRHLHRSPPVYALHERHINERLAGARQRRLRRSHDRFILRRCFGARAIERIGAQRRGQKHSQGPKQVLGVAPMQAICEE